MSDQTVIHMGENSPEHIAYRLMLDVQNIEKTTKWGRKELLDLYAECIHTVRDPLTRLGEKRAIGF